MTKYVVPALKLVFLNGYVKKDKVYKILKHDFHPDKRLNVIRFGPELNYVGSPNGGIPFTDGYSVAVNDIRDDTAYITIYGPNEDPTNKVVEDTLHNHPSLYSKGKVMLDEVTKDAKKFISENRNVLYLVLMVAFLDQVLLGGAFRDRLKSLVEGILNRAEEAVKGTKKAE